MYNNFKYFFLVLFFFCNIATQSQRLAPDKKFDNVTLSQIKSNVLQEERNIYIYTPPDTVENRYPVIYLLDGEKSYFYQDVLEYVKENPHIIIGIQTNKHRRRDINPTVIKNRPSSGGAGKFIEFLVTELQPFIDSSYNTNGYNVLVGCSASGYIHYIHFNSSTRKI